MAFTVEFGRIAKKNNSTLRGTFTKSLDCVLKESCSVLNPSLFVDFGQNPSSFNYCYIAGFLRYYYINNWTYERGRWLAECSVDVMATYKIQIGLSSQYILRASNESDGSIMDTMYPTKNVISERQAYATSPWRSGSYVIGIVSSDSVNGAVTYYAFTSSQFSSLCSYLFGGNIYDFTQITQDISRETWKSLYNPFQYIVSCMYIPIDISANFGSSVNVKVGYWTIPVAAYTLAITVPVEAGFNIPWTGSHPDDARGNYVYCNPYTQVDFSFPAFGFVQLPSDIVYKQGGVDGNVSVDIVTGEGTLYLGDTTFPYMVLKAQIGIPIKLAQMATDVLGMATTAASGVAGVVGSALSGDIAGAIASGVSAIDSTVRSQVPRLSTTGGTGGFSGLIYPPRAIFRYYKLVDEDNNRLGRPLCKHRNVANLGGYMLCENAAVDIPGTMEESQRVQAIMNSGFYYE